MFKINTVLFGSFVALFIFNEPILAAPVVTQTVLVKKQALNKSLSSSGTIKALNNIMLSSQVTGLVDKIYVRNGQYVTKGTPILSFDNRVLHAQFVKAQAAANIERVTYARKHQMSTRAQGTVSQQELDQDYSKWAEANAEAQSYQAQLSQRVLTAPYDGVLGTSLVSIGSFIQSGEHLIRLTSNKDLKIVYTLPASDVGLVKLGQKVTVTDTQNPKHKTTATVSYVSAYINEDNRSIELEAKLDQANQFIPGQFANINQVVNQANVISIPKSAVQYGMKGNYVYKISDHRAIFTLVNARFSGDRAIITSGLKPGDRVATTGLNQLSDKLTVQTTQ